MKSLVTALVVIFASATYVGLSAQEPVADDGKSIVKKLVGSYRIVAGKSNGDDIREDKLADVTVKITEQTITTYDRDKQQQFSASYKLSTDETPWKILMTAIPKKPADPSVTGEAAKVPPETSQGLVELSKDDRKLKIIYALPGGEAPKDFTGGKLMNLFEMERIK